MITQDNSCKICNKQLLSIRSKTCDSSICKSKWKMERNKNLQPVFKSCKSCNSSFETVDRRNNYCSPKCKYDGASKVMIDLYGYGNPSQKPKTEERKKLIAEKTRETNLKKFGHASPKRFNYIKDHNFSSREEMAKSIFEFCENEKVSPHSELVKSTFNVSVFFIGNLIGDFNRQDLLHKFSSSSQEKEIQKYLTSINITDFVCNRRYDWLSGKELDIFIPDKKIAIEFHGLAVHSARNIYGKEVNMEKVKKQHLYKYNACKNNEVKLLQIFEDEWRDHQDIVKSIIRSKLGLIDNKIYARDCTFAEITQADCDLFMKKNHISGSSKHKKSFGLFYNNELVCNISFRKPWNKNYGENIIEISRFSSKLNTQVTGGFQKLLKHSVQYLKNIGFPKILTYSDCRFGSGEVYKQAGFKHVGHTGAGYFYEKGGIRENRFKHRKNSNREGTEVTQNNEDGWYQIYDAGSEIYTLDI